MATRKTHEFHGERSQNEMGKIWILRARRAILDVYRFRESAWNSPFERISNLYMFESKKGRRERERKKKKERRVCKWRVILLERDSVGENCSWFLKLMASIIGLLTVIVSCINIHVHSLVIENGKYIFIEYSLFKYNIIRNIFYRNLFSSKLLQIEINFKTFKQKFCTCVSPITKKILLRE